MTAAAAWRCALLWRGAQCCALLYRVAGLVRMLPLVIGMYFASMCELVLTRVYARLGA